MNTVIRDCCFEDEWLMFPNLHVRNYKELILVLSIYWSKKD